MWQNFDGKPYSREQFLAHLETIPAGRMGWCKFFTVHNTAGPTIEQWCSKVCTPAQRIINLENYYEHSLGWHAGPHGFVPPSQDVVMYGFTNLDVPGVHASCFNSMSIGLEMVGDFDAEDFNSGLGALVKDNAIFVLAALHRKRGLRPDGYKLGVSGLHFHVDCKRDNHACPGKTVNRDALVAAVLTEMERQSGAVPAIATSMLPPQGEGLGEGVVAGSAAAALSLASAPSPQGGGELQDKSSFWDRFNFRDWNFAHVKEMADQGSRIAANIRAAKNWASGIFLGTSGTTGTATQASSLKGADVIVAAHPNVLAVLLGVALGIIVISGLAYLFVKFVIEPSFVSASKGGRYWPRGGRPQAIPQGA